MKKYLITFLVLLTFLTKANELCPGYIVSLAGDTSNVNLDIILESFGSDPSSTAAQGKVRVIDKTGKKTVYKAADISAYGFRYKNELHEYRSFPASWYISKLKMFARIVQDGPCTVFTYLETGTTMNKYYPVLYIKSKESSFIMRDVYMIYSNVQNYISDCPVVVEKIKNKEIKKEAIEIANAYNEACGDLKSLPGTE